MAGPSNIARDSIYYLYISKHVSSTEFDIDLLPNLVFCGRKPKRLAVEHGSSCTFGSNLKQRMLLAVRDDRLAGNSTVAAKLNVYPDNKILGVQHANRWIPAALELGYQRIEFILRQLRRIGGRTAQRSRRIDQGAGHNLALRRSLVEQRGLDPVDVKLVLFEPLRLFALAGFLALPGLLALLGLFLALSLFLAVSLFLLLRLFERQRLGDRIRFGLLRRRVALGLRRRRGRFLLRWGRFRLVALLRRLPDRVWFRPAGCERRHDRDHVDDQRRGG
jgi:hypothetical protein